MKLKVSKIEKDVVLKIKGDPHDEDFDYVKLINFLFDGGDVEVEFESIDDNEKQSILEMFEQIKEKIKA